MLGLTALTMAGLYKPNAVDGQRETAWFLSTLEPIK
jgi:hypothetical protein